MMLAPRAFFVLASCVCLVAGLESLDDRLDVLEARLSAVKSPVVTAEVVPPHSTRDEETHYVSNDGSCKEKRPEGMTCGSNKQCRWGGCSSEQGCCGSSTYVSNDGKKCKNKRC